MRERVLFVLRKLHQDECGQDLIEYALVAAFIAFGSVASMGTLAQDINLEFSAIGSKMLGPLT